MDRALLHTINLPCLVLEIKRNLRLKLKLPRDRWGGSEAAHSDESAATAITGLPSGSSGVAVGLKGMVRSSTQPPLAA